MRDQPASPAHARDQPASSAHAISMQATFDAESIRTLRVTSATWFVIACLSILTNSMWVVIATEYRGDAIEAKSRLEDARWLADSEHLQHTCWQNAHEGRALVAECGPSLVMWRPRAK